MKKRVLYFVLAVFLFCGCGEAEATQIKELPSEIRGSENFGTGLTEGELKESGVVYEDAPVDFQDEVIEEMFRNMLAKPEGEIYISDLQKIHAIYWGGKEYYSNLQTENGRLSDESGVPWEMKQPKSFADLAYCYNLQLIRLSDEMEIPSLEPLFGLPLLEEIMFNGSNVFQGSKVPEKTMEEVGKLHTVKRIYFLNMDLSSIKPLLNLPQLEVLDFTQTTVTKEVLKEIGQMPALHTLYLGHGEFTQWGHLTDGSFLLPLKDQLKKLWAQANIDWNPKVLSQMMKLEDLVIENVNDISFLEHLTELKILELRKCQPEDWSLLYQPKKLKELVIKGNMYHIIEIELEDITPLTNLDYLWIDLDFSTLGKECSRQDIIEAMPNLTGLTTTIW